MKMPKRDILLSDGPLFCKDVVVVSPIIESKPFLLRDSHLPVMTDDGNFLKHVDDDEFSTDSWDQISNEELSNIVEITKGIMSPPVSPSNLSIKSEPFSDDHFDHKYDLAMGSPPVLVRITDKMTSDPKKINLLNDTPETRAVKRERNRLAARRCRQKQKDRIDYLEKDVKEIETENYKVENEIRLLQQQLKDLQDALIHHDCQIKPNIPYFSMKFQ